MLSKVEFGNPSISPSSEHALQKKDISKSDHIRLFSNKLERETKRQWYLACKCMVLSLASLFQLFSYCLFRLCAHLGAGLSNFMKHLMCTDGIIKTSAFSFTYQYIPQLCIQYLTIDTPLTESVHKADRDIAIKIIPFNMFIQFFYNKCEKLTYINNSKHKCLK